MGAISERGFTIIETMLFLAISGVLIVSILAGTGTAINVQRYRDSVVSLQTTIQNQYFDSMNVTNIPPSGALTCNTNATVSIDNNAPSNRRGHSDCVLLGRYVTITDGTMTTSSIVGYNSVDSSTYGNDIDDLHAYNLSVLPGSDETTSLEWGAQIAWPKSGTESKPDGTTSPRTIAILILRSPKSGLTYTFTSDSIPKTLTDIIVAGNQVPGQAERRMCIDSGGPFTGGLAVVIDAYAATTTSIETRSNDMGDASTC